jgi:hypothetical protein
MFNKKILAFSLKTQVQILIKANVLCNTLFLLRVNLNIMRHFSDPLPHFVTFHFQK